MIGQFNSVFYMNTPEFQHPEVNKINASFDAKNRNAAPQNKTHEGRASTRDEIDLLFRDLTNGVNGAKADPAETILAHQPSPIIEGTYMILEWELARRREEMKNNARVSSRHDYFCTNAEQDYEKADFIYEAVAKLQADIPENVKKAKADLYARIHKEIYGIKHFTSSRSMGIISRGWDSNFF